MLETGTGFHVSRSIWNPQKLEIELHIRTLTDLVNHVLEITGLMTRTKPTVGRSVRQSVRSCTVRTASYQSYQ